jgi:hypothetical protein
MAEETSNGTTNAQAKKTAKQGKRGKTKNKSQFVRDNSHLGPTAISELAKKQGLDITPGYASTVKAKAKAKKGEGRKGRAKSSSGGGEAAFRMALRGITLERAQEILDEIVVAFEGK